MSAPDSDQAHVDTHQLRRAFGTFLTGVTVITTRDVDGNPRGMTANSFTSVSLDPPLLLVCVCKSAASFAAFGASPFFAVNLLHEKQIEVSALFASKSANKFHGINHDTVHTGAPIFTNCLTWFDCSVHQRVEAGDHIVLIGRVQAFGTTPSAPLAFCRGRYAEVKDPLPPGWSPSHSMRVSYLIEADGRVLLRSDAEGRWTLPIARRRRADDLLELDECGEITLQPEDTFLYSVFDVADGNQGCIVYRGRLADSAAAESALPSGLEFFPLDALPFERIKEREISAVLRRYQREHSMRSFGIYMDSADGGRIAMLKETPRQWQPPDS